MSIAKPASRHAGDVRHNSIKRVSSGVGEGSMAIAFIHPYLALKSERGYGSETASRLRLASKLDRRLFEIEKV
jgi:hypothetical protein